MPPARNYFSFALGGSEEAEKRWPFDVDRIAAAAWSTFAAGRGVIKVGVASSLQQVSTHRRHVADLSAGALKDHAYQHQLVHPHSAFRCQCGDPDAGTIPATRPLRLGDVPAQTGHVSHRAWPLDHLPHQVDEVGPCTEVTSVAASGGRIDGFGDAPGKRSDLR
ncbi:MAG: hypothetical protein ABI767_00975 [Rhodanobacter sp.]